VLQGTSLKTNVLIQTGARYVESEDNMNLKITIVVTEDGNDLNIEEEPP